MAVKVQGLEGNELAAGDYVRQPKTRGTWGHAWDVFKGNFFKTVLINIFTLIFFIPGVILMIFRGVTVQALGATAPINFMPYPVYPETQGLAENIYLSTDVMFYSLLLVAGLIASIGIAGAAYSIKKLLATNGEFSLKGFFRGVKVGYFNVALPVTIFLVFFVGTVLIGDWKDVVIAQGGSESGPLAAYAFAIIATIIVGVYCAWLLAVGVSYKVKFAKLFQNAFMLMIGSPIQTVFMSGFALIPVWLYLIGTASQIFKIISYAVFIFIGLAFIALVWMAFTQWVFDMYITPNIKAENERVRAQKTEQQLAQEKYDKERQTARELIASGKSEILGTPIKPIDEESRFEALGQTFTRSQVAGVNDGRNKLNSDVEAYRTRHASDPEYAEYNKLFADHERALKENEGKKKSKKKISAENMLGRSKK